jgi:hypothetical protein
VVECRGEIRADHTKQIEPEAEHRQRCAELIALNEEKQTHHKSHQDTYSVRDAVGQLLAKCIFFDKIHRAKIDKIS